MKVRYLLIVVAAALHSLPAVAADCTINTDTMDLIAAKFQALVDGRIAQTIALASAASEKDEAQRMALWTSWGGTDGPQLVGKEIDGFKNYLDNLKATRCAEKK
jgi:hypothetical protein